MAGWRLVRIGLDAGVWHGRLIGDPGASPPGLRASLQGREIGGLDVAPADDSEGGWRVSLRLPAETMSDGVQTVLISDGDGRTLATEQLICGTSGEDDLRSEIAFLRAEIDLLKTAIRRRMSSKD